MKSYRVAFTKTETAILVVEAEDDEALKRLLVEELVEMMPTYEQTGPNSFNTLLPTASTLKSELDAKWHSPTYAVKYVDEHMVAGKTYCKTDDPIAKEIMEIKRQRDLSGV